MNIEVTADMLLSIVETDCFLEQIDFDSDTLFYKETIPFEDKENLQRIVWSKLLDWNTNYMMELTNVKECGLLPIPNLSVFNWNFKYEDEKSGIIVFIRQDKKEELVLDFYEEDFQYFLDIEIYRPIECKNKNKANRSPLDFAKQINDLKMIDILTHKE